MIIINESGGIEERIRGVAGMRVVQALDSGTTMCKFGRVDTERKRIYVITSYRCDGKCLFCLIRHDRCEEMPLAPVVEEACRMSPESVSVSITGGEPLLNPGRVQDVAQAVQRSGSGSRWVGIATNGIELRDIGWAQDSDVPVHIYISRHSVSRLRHRAIMGTPNRISIPSLPALVQHYKAAGAEVMLTCTAVRDVLTSCAEYCVMAREAGVSRVCFRELNRCRDGAYQQLGATYARWRDQNNLPLELISAWLETDPEFEFVNQTVRPYLYHEYWQHKPTGVEVCLRQVDETELASWTDTEGTETVVYPDGTVACGWNHAKE
jgi:MoaA/NifB/PqqE/SkfB family radical SAM enzyme